MMKANLIDGKSVAAKLRQEVSDAVEIIKQSGQTPGLAVILVGNDPASEVYVRNKGQACEKAGIRSLTQKLPTDTSEQELLTKIRALNENPEFHGLLVQLPLPQHISSQKVIETISLEKDVDCFHPFNVGRMMIGMPIFEPATPSGIVELLRHYEIDPAGKHVVIIGRSNIVGKPLANMLIQKRSNANALVTVIHSAAKEVERFTRSADILVAAMGRPEFVRAGMVKEGAIVIDVGTNRVDANTPKGYRLVGDVAFEEVSEIASFISPVPGGVGPMTIAMLLKNTLHAFHLQQRA